MRDSAEGTVLKTVDCPFRLSADHLTVCGLQRTSFAAELVPLIQGKLVREISLSRRQEDQPAEDG